MAQEKGDLAKRIGLVAGPILATLLALWVERLGGSSAAAWTAFVTALCATWWITEPIAIPSTSLIPFAAFPLCGVLTEKQVATSYGHPVILLLLGGFILSKAMERSGAHLRVAVVMMRLVGGHGGRRLVLGFMIAAALLSMWISNTATTLMLLPVATAIVVQDPKAAPPNVLYLSIAYACSIGGLGTPIGTPPNIIFIGAYDELVGGKVSFLEWMGIGIPVVLVLLPTAWWILTRKLTSTGRVRMPRLGDWRSAERRVLLVFLVTAIAWMSRTAPFGGWSKWFHLGHATDGTVALTAVLAMFLLPDGEGDRLLDWKTASEIPWGLLLLFAGGLAIAQAFVTSGLSTLLGDAMGGLAKLPAWLMVALLCLCVTFLTEVTSNTATATLLMPILGAAAIAAKIEPKLLMVPAAISASCAFMLPVATAPNAIVFGTGQLTIKEMARRGLALNLIGAVVISVLCLLLL